MTRVIGCSDSLNLKPCDGCSRTGAEIFTPAMGPATVGAVGLELFAVWQPPSASRSRPQVMVNERRVMANLGRKPNGSGRARHAEVHACSRPIGLYIAQL